MLDYRPLGRTDIRVSAICLGTMTWGQQNTEAEGHEQLDYALEQGINFIDTAEMYSIPPRAETYGSTEKIIGNWLQTRQNRSKIILASKAVGPFNGTYARANGQRPRLDRANLREAVENSLRRLRTDYLDLYQLHWPDRAVKLFGAGGPKPEPDPRETPIEVSLAALDEMVKEGKIRHIGVSNETPWGVARFLQLAEAGTGPRIVSIQNAYNLLNRVFEEGLSEFAYRDQVGLLAYSPLAQGYLTGKYLDGARPAGTRTTLFNRGQRYEKPGTDTAIKSYLQIATDFGLDPAQLALAYVASRDFVTSNIIGATSLSQLKTDIASHEVIITPEIESRIDAVHQLHGSPSP